MSDIFWQAASILKRGIYEYTTINIDANRYYQRSYGFIAKREATDHTMTRVWHAKLQHRFVLHPTIMKAMQLARPDNWQQLLLEWPHVAVKDSTRLAYTVNERKGEEDAQTMTSVGKYLTRHFSSLPAHAIRDLAALSGKGDCKIVRTSVEMVYHLERGPRSCMQWGDGTDPDEHPYQTYAPKYGWGMAVRIVDGSTVGRALVMEDGCTKYFVRSYLRNDDGYSGRDDILEAWLKNGGYEHHGGWDEGTKLRFIENDGNNCGFIAPYIDGCNQNVDVIRTGSESFLRISDGGEYQCDNTDGDADSVTREECSDCGSYIDDGDGYWAGYHEDALICPSCENDYRVGRGRNGREYRFHEDNAIYVESRDNYYHTDYLDDNNIVELENGDYEHIDQVVDVDGEYYLLEDERVCLFKDTGEWGMCEDGWQCTHSCDWYTDDTEYVEVGGEKFHPDYCPETEGE
jgi:hypothetical protein